MAKNTEVAVVKRDSTLPVHQTSERFITPFADVYETADAFVLTVDMPGVTKGSVSVTMERKALLVKASVEPYHKENAVVLVNELENAGYYRAFNLGDGIDRDNVDARFEDGVLTITLFKSEQLKPREIRIK
jgi:HSP20 family protein